MKRVIIAVHPKFFERFDQARRAYSTKVGKVISQPDFSHILVKSNMKFPELNQISKFYRSTNAKKGRYI